MIESPEQYKAEEARLKELLGNFAAAGDLVDKKNMTSEGGDWQKVAGEVAALKDELKAYRDSHPEEFQTNG